MINQRWKWLIGNSEDFPVENRIFHSFSLVSIISLLIHAFCEFFLDMYAATILSVLFALMQIFLYYYSRFKGKSKIAITITAIFTNVICAIAFIQLSGITGSMPLFFAATIILVVLITPRNQWLPWIFLNIVTVLGLVLFQYLYPTSVISHYHDRGKMFIDVGSSYLVVVSLLYFCSSQLRRSYDNQRIKLKDKADKLEVMNMEKNKLFSIIAHDLTTPLASVKQYMELYNFAHLNEREREIIETDLITSLDDAQYLLSNLLQWASSQQQNKLIQLQSTKLKPTLEQTIHLFEQRAALKNISIVVSIDPGIYVISDQNMLCTVVRNLLNNALKFTPSGGSIEIITIITKNKCVLEIKDNGVGILQEEQAKIFTSSVISSYGTANEKGTGLGLLLSKDFMKKQNGEIWFESKAGVGTSFYISFPTMLSFT